MSDSDANPALTITIARLRQTPDLDSRFRKSGRDSVAVCGWLNAIDRYLTGSQRRKGDEHLSRLLGTAREFLEEIEPAWLRALWRQVTSSDAWLRLPPSARDMYELVHAIAGCGCGYGGPNVALAHRVALACMEHRTGRRYRNISAVTQVIRPALEKAGLVTVIPGARWSAGKARSSVYCLPTELALPPVHQEGLVQLGAPAVPYPQWTAEDDFVFTVACGQRREEKAKVLLELKFGAACTLPDPEAEFGHLIDVSPGGGDLS